jgi:hypothetical protein
MSSAEVRTHSAFIAELLNPEGCHGQGDLYLNLFIEQIIGKSNEPFVFENVKVEVEKFIGSISEDKETGGFIDILVSSKNDLIIIENKIYAEDQYKQLVRYANYGKSTGKRLFIFYLTLELKDARESSKGDLILDKHYKNITYKTDIINWLSKCIKESSTLPIVRETIIQYSNLLKKLTHQTMNKNMSDEIVEHILKSNNIEAALNIGSNISNLKVSIVEELVKHLNKNEELSDLKISIRFNTPNGKKGNGILFRNDGMKYDVQFYSDNNFEEVYYGISDADDRWVPYGNNIPGTYFKEWEIYSWTNVYEGKQELIEIIIDKVNYLLEEMKLIN